ncbi:protein EXECUTER 2, chloroplastic-like [Ipomoea triloba]|uniref:protein EXECUTER 2, chloroplastic-like n=1 Tax=Ipomoea triloba TaxID=35885 RepID=UPI00125DB5CA|nr:protein EXECUTER 2, chloroplastic-like [Ipomoea triloba]XP_031105026.1 protein EXECUTER 2, chloroplastic-like [Ipomoea triloba]
MAVANAWHAPHSQPRPSLSSSSSSSFPSSSSSHDHRVFPRRNPILLYPNGNKLLFLRDRLYSKLRCRCSKDGPASPSAIVPGTNSSCSSDYTSASDSSNWDWNRWTRHFSEMEQAESYASVLKFQLEDAVENEDFLEAAKLKTAIAEATSKDTIAEIMLQLKNAIVEERYHDASRLCRSTGSGLVGWWVGYSKDSGDPFGRLVRITPGMGRFIGRTYTPRQLVNASPGTPLFEIYVVKEANNSYNMQVVFLKRTKPTKANSTSSDSKSVRPSSAELENASVIDVKVNEDETERSKGKSMDVEEAAEEGIKSVINFLKDKIPDLKVKVMKLNVGEEVIEDGDSVRQVVDDDSENSKEDDDGTISGEFSEDEGAETTDLDDNHHDQISVGGESSTAEDEKSQDMKLFVGGVLHNKEDNPTKDEFIRMQAEIKDLAKDSFVFHLPKTYQDHDSAENSESAVGVAAIAAQSVSELMPPDVAKVFLSSDKVSSKISKNVREILKLVVSQAKKRDRLSEYTNFTRITTSGSDLDPFDGLYVGAFGPYGTEVVQLKRKYGNWNVRDEEKSSGMEFFEYVEAVKLTGDMNVPAGQVTFRAKIGKGNRFTNKGMYPDELGVVASYKGQGRIAEYGFKNPKWVEGELLQLNGKGVGPHIKGADLGFLYVIPEHSFLVLFSRLKLPE